MCHLISPGLWDPFVEKPGRLWRDGVVHKAVVREQANLRVNDQWKVIYMAQIIKAPIQCLGGRRRELEQVENECPR